jgi:hypothetical protein
MQGLSLATPRRIKAQSFELRDSVLSTLDVVPGHVGWDLVERTAVVPVLLPHPGLVGHRRQPANELVSRNQDHLLRSP